ncbi:MAG: HU family DNA-binding protein [Thermoanaerobaculia bacterium]
MARIDPRKALEALTKSRLLEIATAFDLEVTPRPKKSDLIERLARSRRASLERILTLLKRDELKAICLAAGLDASGRRKAPIAARILGEGSAVPTADSTAMRLAVRGTLTRADLVEEVVAAADILKKDAEIIVHGFFDAIAESLGAGRRVELRGFGTFGVRQSKARIGRNPATGVEVEVPAKRVPFFKPGKKLKIL